MVLSVGQHLMLAERAEKMALSEKDPQRKEKLMRSAKNNRMLALLIRKKSRQKENAQSS